MRAPLEEIGLAEDVMPLGQLLLRSAMRSPDKDALVFPDERISYRQLADRAWGVACSLVALGVQPGEHVGVFMTNHPDLVASVFGASLIGSVVVPVNARYKANELRFLIDDADLVVLLTHDHADAHVDFTALINEALDGLDAPKLRTLVQMGQREPEGFLSRKDFDALGERADEQLLRTRVEGVPLRDTALILYTSGTTSNPRGAMFSHEAFVRTWMVTANIWETTSEDRLWSALPLFHVTALGTLTWVIGKGATFYSDYSFDAARTVATLRDEKITQFYPAYQPVTEAVLAHPDFDKADLSAINTWLNVAPPEVLEKFQNRLPHAVQLTTYGGTEGGCVTLTRRDDPLEVRLHTCGAPQPGLELRVVDPSGRPLGPGERGIIQFRGYNTLSGYWKAPEKTAETMLEDGWVTMQDLGVLDRSGRVLFLGRVKETLKVGGENVAPQEIEAQLSTHPAVKLVSVVGIPDQRLIEVPAAFVELLPGHEDTTEEELIEHCRGRIASFKVPRLIRFIGADEWPMSATKLQRFKLRDRLLDELVSTAKEQAPA
jgi:acyl-CoA synthetase (AMP-forming)/AMP-acid ligase II